MKQLGQRLNPTGDLERAAIENEGRKSAHEEGDMLFLGYVFSLLHVGGTDFCSIGWNKIGEKIFSCKMKPSDDGHIVNSHI